MKLKSVRDQVWRQVGHQIWTQVRAQVWAQVNKLKSIYNRV